MYSDKLSQVHTLTELFTFAPSEGTMYSIEFIPSTSTSLFLTTNIDLQCAVLKIHSLSTALYKSPSSALTIGGNWLPSVPRMVLQVLFPPPLPSASTMPFHHRSPLKGFRVEEYAVLRSSI